MNIGKIDEPIKKISLGRDFSMILSSSGRLYSTGSNENGCLGLDLQFPIVATPTPIPTLQEFDVGEISSGETHTLVLVRNICYGLDARDNNVCSGHGECLKQDTCGCDHGWMGKNCNVTRCFDVLSTNSTTCSGNGECISRNRCKCKSGFVRDNCAEFTCYGTTSTNTTYACSGYGVCTQVDQCVCKKGYFGLECAEWKCNNIGRLESTACGKRGVCKTPNQCLCLDYHWIGSSCQFPFSIFFYLWVSFASLSFITFAFFVVMDIRMLVEKVDISVPKKGKSRRAREFYPTSLNSGDMSEGLSVELLDKSRGNSQRAQIDPEMVQEEYFH